MLSVTAGAPTNENSKSQAISYKNNNRKNIKLHNTKIRRYGSVTVCVMTSPVTPYRYWQCCLSVRHTSQLHGGSRSPSHVYQVTDRSHVAYRTQTTNSYNSLTFCRLRQPFCTVWNGRVRYCLYV